MNGFEKIKKAIEEIAKNNQSPKIELGTYKDGGIELDNLFIPPTMIYKLDYLDKKRATKVNGTVEVGGAGDAAHSHGWTDTSEYINELQNGDIVAFQKINVSKVLIIGRVAQ